VNTLSVFGEGGNDREDDQMRFSSSLNHVLDARHISPCKGKRLMTATKKLKSLWLLSRLISYFFRSFAIGKRGRPLAKTFGAPSPALRAQK